MNRDEVVNSDKDNGPLNETKTELGTISRALDNFKKYGRKNYTAARIRQRMSSLKETWARCVLNHATLLQGYPEDKQDGVEYFQNNQLEAHEEIYQNTLDYMADCLEELEPPGSPNQSVTSGSIITDNTAFALRHLPPIELPPFSGLVAEWESFRDRFDALIIQNKELTNFSRMHYLTSSLTGRARDTIAGLTITANNFEAAWKALQARFENKRRIIETHVAALYDLPRLARESAADLHSLRDTAEKAIAALQRMNRSSEDILNDILVYFVSLKLDSATRRAWKLKFNEESDPSNFKILVDLSHPEHLRSMSSLTVTLPNRIEMRKSMRPPHQLTLRSRCAHSLTSSISVRCFWRRARVNGEMLSNNSIAV